MIRVIHYSNTDGSLEGVYFTEELNIDPYAFIPPHCSVDNDFTIEEELPSTFPLNYNLERKH